MAKEITVRLGDIVSQTMTRTRGKEAFAALQKKIAETSASRVYLNMDVQAVVTTSFIDELVLDAARIECEGGAEIVFVLSSREMLDKFQKSVSWRQLIVRYREQEDSTVKTLQPGAAWTGLSMEKPVDKVRMQPAG